ncbi:MAG: sulfotransferase family protein [Gammaproteobacteria bacterium]
MDTDFKVLYVMGLWRSGSTVLDIVLGNHERIESVGELRNLPIVAWSGNGLCACGATANACTFWEAVRLRWEEKVGDGRVQELIALQDRYERMRSLPTLLCETLWSSPNFHRYAELVGALYSAIRDVSGKNVIVDSSKFPARAYALLRMPGIDVRLLHLVRDGRAVIWSCKRNPNTDLEGNVLDHNPSAVARNTVTQWLMINLACDILARLARGRAVRIRYEDFALDPSSVLGKIGEIAGLDLSRISEGLAHGQDMNVGHTIAGNRVRMQRTVRLAGDLEWRDKLPAEDRGLFWRRAGWLARKYGYEKS